MKTRFFSSNLPQAVARSFNNRRRARWAAALLTTLLLTGTVAASVTFVLQWGSFGADNGQFNLPYDVAVNSAGQVYVVDRGNKRIQKFDANGNFLTTWGSEGSDNGQFYYPEGIAVDSSGNVYVADNGRIQKFGPNGAFLANVVTGIVALDVAIGPAGNIYVCGGIGADAIGVFDANGTLINSWGSNGPSDEQFDLTPGIAVDSAGNVYVTDMGKHRIHKFSSNGTLLTRWGSYGSGDGQFQRLGKVEVDSAGNVYVTDVENRRVQKFDANGNFIEKWGSEGSGNGEFLFNFGLAVNSSGNVYVADLLNSRIQKFSQGYNFSGFFEPVDNLPTVNAAKAGAAIPVKFSLGGDRGMGIFAAGFPTSQQIACSSSAPLSDIEETITAGASSLTYDPATYTYTYVWKTSTTWKGTCRRLTVKLSDGSTHVANFQFK